MERPAGQLRPGLFRKAYDTVGIGENFPTPGEMVFKTRQKFTHGLKTAYYRDVVRKKILETLPIGDLSDSAVELHTMTGKDDLINLFWTLKTFYHYSRRRYKLCIHEDGSLDDKDKEILADHFRGARIIERDIADREVCEGLKEHPACLEFREKNHLAPKVFDCRHYLEANRMLLFDSDLLFFSEPSVLLERAENPNYLKNTFNWQKSSAYTLTPEELSENLGIQIQPSINSGCALIHRESMNLNFMEAVLSVPNFIGHFWRIEQTLFACFSSKWGVELLPHEYEVHRDSKERTNQVFRHYVGPIRHLMYKNGIPKLIGQNFLKETGLKN